MHLLYISLDAIRSRAQCVERGSTGTGAPWAMSSSLGALLYLTAKTSVSYRNAASYRNNCLVYLSLEICCFVCWSLVCCLAPRNKNTGCTDSLLRHLLNSLVLLSELLQEFGVSRGHTVNFKGDLANEADLVQMLKKRSYQNEIIGIYTPCCDSAGGVDFILCRTARTTRHTREGCAVDETAQILA